MERPEEMSLHMLLRRMSEADDIGSQHVSVQLADYEPLSPRSTLPVQAKSLQQDLKAALPPPLAGRRPTAGPPTQPLPPLTAGITNNWSRQLSSPLDILMVSKQEGVPKPIIRGASESSDRSDNSDMTAMTVSSLSSVSDLSPVKGLHDHNGHHHHHHHFSQDLKMRLDKDFEDKSKLLRADIFQNMSMVSPAPSPLMRSTDDLQGVRARQALKESLEADEKASSVDEATARQTVQGLPDRLPQVFCESRARIPTTSGTEIFLHVYRNDQDNKEHLAIVFGDDIRSQTLFAVREGETEHDRMTRGAYTGRLFPGRESSQKSDDDGSDNSPSLNLDTLVRIHSECYTGETAWSARCDCGEQLDEAARLMAGEKKGIIVYLRQEGRGIGLVEKLKAYNLQDLGADTVTANLMLRHPADARSFGLATAILKDLGQTDIRLLTNNPDKITAVEGKHKEIRVTQRVPMVPLSWQNKGGVNSKEVNQYLKTKVERMGHLLDLSI